MATIDENLKLTLNFYLISDPPNTIEKDLNFSVTTERCYPYDSLNTLNPTFILKYSNNGLKDYSKYNYFYVNEWDRYYFMKPPVYEKGKVYITGEEDVLMTFKTEILDQEVLVERTPRKESNAYLPDGGAQPYVPVWTSTINFPEKFSEDWLFNDRVLVQSF